MMRLPCDERDLFNFKSERLPAIKKTNECILWKNNIYQLGGKGILDSSIGLNGAPYFSGAIEATDYGLYLYKIVGFETGQHALKNNFQSFLNQ